jgi:hypothetical protein
MKDGGAKSPVCIPHRRQFAAMSNVDRSRFVEFLRSKNIAARYD